MLDEEQQKKKRASIFAPKQPGIFDLADIRIEGPIVDPELSSKLDEEQKSDAKQGGCKCWG